MNRKQELQLVQGLPDTKVLRHSNTFNCPPVDETSILMVSTVMHLNSIKLIVTLLRSPTKLSQLDLNSEAALKAKMLGSFEKICAKLIGPVMLANRVLIMHLWASCPE